MKKNNFLWIIFFLLLFIMSLIFIYQRYLKKEKGPIYTIVYEDESIPGSESEILVYEEELKIKTTHFCSALDCDSTVTNEVYHYSKENQNKLVTFLKDNFKEKTIKLYENELSNQQEEVITGILLGESYFEIAVEEYEYRMEYSEDDTSTYEVYFKEDGSILVKKLEIRNYDIVGCETYSLNFSKENLNALKEYIKEELKGTSSKILYKNSTLRKDEVNFINSIIQNNESYLKDTEAKLLYTISYDGINCLTPTLYLYDDGSYEYYDTFSVENKKLTPKTGTYNYDIERIIQGIDSYEENEIGSYTIEDADNNSYTTYNTNVELQEFLSSFDFTLEKCLEQE